MIVNENLDSNSSKAQLVLEIKELKVRMNPIEEWIKEFHMKLATIEEYLDIKDDSSPLQDRLNYIDNLLDGHKDWIELYGKNLDQLEAKYQAVKDHKAGKVSVDMLNSDMTKLETKVDEAHSYAKASNDRTIGIDNRIKSLQGQLGAANEVTKNLAEEISDLRKSLKEKEKPELKEETPLNSLIMTEEEFRGKALFMLTVLIKECWQTAEDKGFHTLSHSPGELLALIHSEVSECLEAYRNPGFLPARRKQRMGEELADVVIRVFDASKQLNLKLAEAILKKMKENKSRPHLHGGKRL